jgi:hypothetical protein
VKHTSTKIDKQTPKQSSRHHSRIENSNDKSKRNGLNVSRTSNSERHGERYSSRKKEKKTHKPNPEEHGAMPQLWQCPPANYHEDRNPKCHEEHKKYAP